MKKSIVAASIAWALSSSASALVLDFNNHPLGSTITDQYATQGVWFENVVTGRTLERGTYLRAGFTMHLDMSILNPDGALFGLAFLAFSPNDVYLNVESSGGLSEVAFVSGLANPFCSTKPECDAGGWSYTLDRWSVAGAGLYGDAVRITFSGVDVDSMYFGTDASSMYQGAQPGRTEIPEPGSLALIGLGLAGAVVAGRRRRA